MEMASFITNCYYSTYNGTVLNNFNIIIFFLILSKFSIRFEQVTRLVMYPQNNDTIDSFYSTVYLIR
jgi:hypothetical protein